MADSKKRVSNTQLTRDDSDPDDNETEPEMGSFKKASEEVMATRRIIKVRRGAPQQAAPSANPFSGICLVTPTATSGSQETETENKDAGENKETDKLGLNGNETCKTSQNGDVEGEGKEKEENNSEGISGIKTGKDGEKVESKDTSNISIDEVKENDASESKGDIENKTESQKETENEDESKADEKERSAPVQAGSVGLFGQLSSGQNAFKGLAGTGFSTSSCSFGSISSEGSAPVSSFGNTGSVSGPVPVSSLKEVPVETGEEDEKTVFTADAVLFEFLQGSWKERGKGEVKLNLPVSDKGKKPRLVMRTKGNYRLVLNASLFPDMALKDMDKKGVSFACLNSAGEGEAGSGFSTLALKFREGGIRDNFCGVVSAHKGEKEKQEAAVAKSFENSPEESKE